MYIFFFLGASWTARPAQPLGRRDVSDSCSAFFSVEPLSLRLPRDNIIFHSHSLVVCVGACGAFIIRSQKTNSFLAGLLEKQSANNVLFKNRSRSVIRLCGFFHPFDNDLHGFEGQTLLWVACVPRKNLRFFAVRRSQLPSFRDMLRQVPV